MASRRFDAGRAYQPKFFAVQLCICLGGSLAACIAQKFSIKSVRLSLLPELDT